MHFQEAVPLAPLTTLRLGGPARRLVSAEREDEIATAIREADARGERVLVLGGGSNLVVGDDGFDGLVVRIASHGVAVTRLGDRVRLDVAAGEGWDALVERCVGEGWSGVECLSGIPGLVGATPIQNVGAYGQEVDQTITRVRVFDRRSGEIVALAPEACGFGYRRSIFKGADRYVVTGVTFELGVRAESAPVTYAELTRALGIAEGGRAPLGEVRSTVLGLRRGKGMVIDDGDPESVSAGSFFVNPLLDDAALGALEARLEARLGAGVKPPRFAGEAGLHKVSAAWLIERAGFPKGTGDAKVGVSRKHALALVNRGGATARELLAFAAGIQRAVRDAFGVELRAEPVIVER
jgi:UDP-N-acetylmuramate dehydrogenase